MVSNLLGYPNIQLDYDKNDQTFFDTSQNAMNIFFEVFPLLMFLLNFQDMRSHLKIVMTNPLGNLKPLQIQCGP